MFKQTRARPKQRRERDQSALNVCWRRAHHSPPGPGPGPGSQTLEFNDRSPSRQEPDDRTVPRRRRDDREPLYENCGGALQAAGARAAAAASGAVAGAGGAAGAGGGVQAHVDRVGVGVGRLYGRLDVIGSGVGRIERHLSSSCGSINHYHYQCEYEWCGRLQWVLLQRPPPPAAPAPACRTHLAWVQAQPPPPAPPPPGPLDEAPPPSCSYHNLPESYVTERAYSVKKCHRARKVSPRADSCDAVVETAAFPEVLEAPATQATLTAHATQATQVTHTTQDGQDSMERSSEGEPEEERLDWSLLIPEEEGSYFGHDDYDSDSDNDNGRSMRSLSSARNLSNASLRLLSTDEVVTDTKTAPKDVYLNAGCSIREALPSTWKDLSQPSTSKSNKFGQPFSFNVQCRPSTPECNDGVLTSKDANSLPSNDDTNAKTCFEGCGNNLSLQAFAKDTEDLLQLNITQMADAQRRLKDKKDITTVAKDNKQSDASPKGTKEMNPLREVFKLVSIPKEINNSNGAPEGCRYEGSRDNDKIGRASEDDDSSDEENKEVDI